MQSDPPQGDPRLQRTPPPPKVATGYVDPCIVYFETTLKGEKPFVAACWARSSREIREPGRPTRLQLDEVVVLECRVGRRDRWIIIPRMKTQLCLKKIAGGHSPEYSYFRTTPSSKPASFQSAIRYLDVDTDRLFSRHYAARSWANSPRNPLFRLVFEYAKLDWPSIAEIIASELAIERQLSWTRPRSLVARLISSVFRKKPTAVPA